MTDFTDAQKNTKVLDIIKSITQAGNKKKIEEDQQFCQQLKARRHVVTESSDRFDKDEHDRRLRHHEGEYRYHRDEGLAASHRVLIMDDPDLKKAYDKVSTLHLQKAQYHAAQIHKLNKGLKD